MDYFLLSLLFVCLFVFLSASAATDEPIYKALGASVVLTPGSQQEDITSIMWKHGDNIALSWDQSGHISYRQFKVIAKLNTSTGALTITTLSRNESGNYTLEINDKVISTTRLQVIAPVSKPTLSKRCNAQMTYCLLTCEGNTSDAEPITFKWKADDMVFESRPTNVWNISQERREYWLRCYLENPVSFASSDPMVNPFSSRYQHGLVGAGIGACVIIALVIAGVVINRRNQNGADGRAQNVRFQEVQQNDNPAPEIPNGGAELPNSQQAQDTQTSGTPVSPETGDGSPVTSEVSGEPVHTPAEASESNSGAGNSAVTSDEQAAAGQTPAVDEQEVDEAQKTQ